MRTHGHPANYLPYKAVVTYRDYRPPGGRVKTLFLLMYFAYSSGNISWRVPGVTRLFPIATSQHGTSKHLTNYSKHFITLLPTYFIYSFNVLFPPNIKVCQLNFSIYFSSGSIKLYTYYILIYVHQIYRCTIFKIDIK